MAKFPAQKKSRLSLSTTAMGPKLFGFGVGLFVVTRIIKWLPLGILGSWINGLLWPVLVLSIIAGGGLMYMKSERS
jgi:hypothetical protein